MTQSRSVTVIVPAHNCEVYLAETLDSLLAQSHPPVQIVVVDDGSTDATRAVAEHVAATATIPVDIVANPTPRGVARARNAGAAIAEGDWLGFCDNDDLWHPRLLETALGMLDTHPHSPAVAVGSLNFALDEDREALRSHQREAMIGHWVPRSDIETLVALTGRVDGSDITLYTPADFRSGPVFSTTQMVMRREEFRAAGGFASWCHRADDWVLNGALAAAGDIPSVGAGLVYYRVRASSQSHHQAESVLPLLSANVALRFGGAVPDSRPNSVFYQHLLLEHLRSGGSLRRAVGFSLLGSQPSPRALRTLVATAIRARRARRDQNP